MTSNKFIQNPSDSEGATYLILNVAQGQNRVTEAIKAMDESIANGRLSYFELAWEFYKSLRPRERRRVRHYKNGSDEPLIQRYIDAIISAEKYPNGITERVGFHLIQYGLEDHIKKLKEGERTRYKGWEAKV